MRLWLVVFHRKDGKVGDVFEFPTKREAFAAKDEWEAEWESDEEVVVYRASLWKASR